MNAMENSPAKIWIERPSLPAIVRNFLDDHYPNIPLMDISPILGAMRVIKSPFEINVMKQAGEIDVAMMAAAHNSPREEQYKLGFDRMFYTGDMKDADAEGDGWF